MTHPALLKAPRTLREALATALEFIKTTDNFGGCRYLKDGKSCVIGNFFTADQLQWLLHKYQNDAPVHRMAGVIGMKNFHAMLFMSVDQAGAIQGCFDKKQKQYLISNLESILSTGKGAVNYTRFILDTL